MPGLWVEKRDPPTLRVVVFVHGSLDRASRSSRRSCAGWATFTPSCTTAGLRRLERCGTSVHRGQPGRRPVVRDARARGGRGGTANGGNIALAAAQGAWPRPCARCWSRSRRRCRGPSGGLATSGGYSIVRQSQADADPADISERFMRRMIGDDRWERLPAATNREPLGGPRPDRGDHGPREDRSVRRCGHRGPGSRRPRRERGEPSPPVDRVPVLDPSQPDDGHRQRRRTRCTASHPDEFAAIVRLAVATCG